MKTIKTKAVAKPISMRIEVNDEENKIYTILNEGQYAMALVPTWIGYGDALEDGTKLKAGQHYNITIEVEEG